MLGTTAFMLGVWPDAPADPAALLAGWERFGLPLTEVRVEAGAGRPRSAALLDVDAGDAQLSTIRRDGDLQVRLWNPHRDRPVAASMAEQIVHLGPARIATLSLGSE